MARVPSVARCGKPVAALATVFACVGCSSSTGESVADGRVAATAFEHVRLITGDGVEPLEDFTVIVDSGRFAGMGPSDSVRLPAGTARVDLTGKTIMPAIVDTHTHLSQTRDALADDLKRRAYYGVGAAMSLGQDTGDVAFQVRAEPIPGAALFRTAGRGITMPEPGRTQAPYWVTSQAAGRQAVRELATKRVDIVKIWVDDRNGQYKKLPPELYRSIIEEAHKNDLRVTAHIFNLADAKELLRAGIDAFAHGIRDVDVDDELVELFKKRPEVVLVPNLPDRGVATDLGWLSDSVPQPELKKLQDAAVDRPEAKRAFEIQARNLAKLNAAGVRIALGTDGNTPWGPHVEMADMVAAGMSPAQVIVAATRNGAAFLRLPDAGTIAAGKSADFVVLDGNPVEDITNTRRISSVYLRGEAVDRAPHLVNRTAPSTP